MGETETGRPKFVPPKDSSRAPPASDEKPANGERRGSRESIQSLDDIIAAAEEKAERESKEREEGTRRGVETPTSEDAAASSDGRPAPPAASVTFRGDVVVPPTTTTTTRVDGRATVFTSDPSEFVVEAGGGGGGERGARKQGRSASIVAHPEVDMIIRELHSRISTLESLLGSAGGSDDANDGGRAAPPQDRSGARGGVGSAVTVTMTREQRNELAGLSSNVRGLIRCLVHRDEEHRRRILLEMETDDSGGEDVASLVRVARTESQRNLLNRLLGPEPPERPRGRSGRRQTVEVSTANDEATPIPKDLILGMMEDGNATRGGGDTGGGADGRGERASALFTAAHLAHTYGGVELPRRFQVADTRARKRRTLKGFAKALSGANTFVNQVRLEINFGRDELEYLPREFSRLGLRERQKLAKMLSWGGLKSWGLDAFGVERLSSVMKFQKSKSQKFKSTLNCDLDDSGEDEYDDNFVESAKHGCPLVLIGWALLASPYSQLAMAKNVDDKDLIEVAYKAIKQRANTNKGNMAQRMMEDAKNDGGGDTKGDNIQEEGGKKGEKPDQAENTNPGKKVDDAWHGGYFLPDEFEVKPRNVCHFFRKVEKDYSPRSVNPYHNNIHAADVLQTTHALIQMGGEDMALAYTPLETYSIMLAAALHDVKHPGNNNNYEVNKMTDLSLMYNDVSVLENMHASRASYWLEGLDEKDKSKDAANESANIVLRDGGPSSGMLGSMTKEQRKALRASMIKSILSTDMSRHFSEVDKMRRHVEALEDDIVESGKGGSTTASFLNRIGGQKHAKPKEKFLPFLLHMADISNPTKPRKVSLEWADAVYAEFFQQGDKEAAEDLPISPLCDRSTTNQPDSQLGFMNYVVKPAFLLLARMIPRTKEVVVRQLEENFEYWKKEQEKQKDEKE